jgi:hypothetical protein
MIGLPVKYGGVQAAVFIPKPDFCAIVLTSRFNGLKQQQVKRISLSV